jgi:hypothetical protein
MPRLLAPALAAASLAVLAACEPPPAPASTSPPVTAPNLGSDLGGDIGSGAAGAPAGSEPAAVAADQVQVEPIPGLGD